MSLQHRARGIVDNRRQSLSLKALAVIRDRDSSVIVQPPRVNVTVPEPRVVEPPSVIVQPSVPQVRVENIVQTPEVVIDVHVPDLPPAVVNIKAPEQPQADINVQLVVPPEAIKVDVTIPPPIVEKWKTRSKPPTMAKIVHSDGTTSTVTLE